MSGWGLHIGWFESVWSVSQRIAAIYYVAIALTTALCDSLVCSWPATECDRDTRQRPALCRASDTARASPRRRRGAGTVAPLLCLRACTGLPFMVGSERLVSSHQGTAGQTGSSPAGRYNSTNKPVGAGSSPVETVRHRLQQGARRPPAGRHREPSMVPNTVPSTTRSRGTHGGLRTHDGL